MPNYQNKTATSNTSLVCLDYLLVNWCAEKIKAHPKSSHTTYYIDETTYKKNIASTISAEKLLYSPLPTLEWIPLTILLPIFKRRIHSKIITVRLGLASLIFPMIPVLSLNLRACSTPLQLSFTSMLYNPPNSDGGSHLLLQTSSRAPKAVG